MPTHVEFGMPLSARQRHMLALVAAGRTDQQMATAAHVSLSVAKREMHNIRTKLGAQSRAHAVAIGFARGYLKVREGAVAR